MATLLLPLLCATAAPLMLAGGFAASNRLDHLFPEPYSSTRAYCFPLKTRRLVEGPLALAAAVLFGVAVGVLGPQLFAGAAGELLSFFVLACFALAVVDGARQYLPDVLTLPLGAAGLLANGVFGILVAPEDAVLGMVVGAALLELPRQVALYGSGSDAIGGGDVKFLAAIGAWLGLPGVVGVATVGLILAFIWGVVRRMRGRQEMPLGPWLALGVAAVLVADVCLT